jgi:hypothetical protein
MAAAEGHADVLRLLLERLPGGENGEALAYAVCFGHSACMSLLKETRFAWTGWVMRLLGVLGREGLRRVAWWYGASGGIAGRRRGECESLCAGVRALALDGEAPGELVRLYVERLGEEWVGSVRTDDEAFMGRLRGVGKLVQGDAVRWLTGGEWLLLEKLGVVREV